MKTIASAIILILLTAAFPFEGLSAERLTQAEVDLMDTIENDLDEFFDPFAEAEVSVWDPVEPFNRGMFWLNDRLYFYAFKPIARGYRIVPERARLSVANFFSNLATPIRFVNATLQFKFRDAGVELGRFAVNTTIGVAGFFDPASSYGWLPKDEDFGQTLGHYGAGPGFYLVLPVLGPSTVRDGIGRIADYFLDPIPYILDTGEVVLLKAYDSINDLSLDPDSYEAIKEQALDPYLFVRDAYLQRREGLIRQ
jgi:phospholipid-binding lipoprotein MlaA